MRSNSVQGQTVSIVGDDMMSVSCQSVPCCIGQLQEETKSYIKALVLNAHRSPLILTVLLGGVADEAMATPTTSYTKQPPRQFFFFRQNISNNCPGQEESLNKIENFNCASAVAGRGLRFELQAAEPVQCAVLIHVPVIERRTSAVTTGGSIVFRVSPALVGVDQESMSFVVDFVSDGPQVF